MKNFILITSIVFAGLIISSCSDIRENLPEAPDLSMHKDGFIIPGSPNFHGNVIRNANWDMNECKQCHAADYNGGTANASCYDCHSNPGGPEACNTCHGESSDPLRWSPPQSLSGAINPSERGVGAHLKHLIDNGIGLAVSCTECHTLPSSFNDPNHIDKTSGAEIIFGDFSQLVTNIPTGFSYDQSLGDFIPNPTFNPSDATCSNTYCHGYFKNGNTTNVVAFTSQSEGAKCGSCHGDPNTGIPTPRTIEQGGTHPVVTNCAQCHPGVFEFDGTNYTIIDKSKHINGKLNIFGREEVY